MDGSARKLGWVLAGAIVVLAAPSALLWHTLQPDPWDAAHVRVRFQSVRYERAGLVFRYQVENRTRRSERFLPDAARIRVVQAANQPVAGYPVIQLPLEFAPHATRQVEVRLELPLPHTEADDRRKSEEQTARVLQHKLPGPHDLESPLAALPMTRPPAPPQPDGPVKDIETIYQEALSIVDGFELVNDAGGIRIVFPRGW
jgi:hypothetical protein